ncbi:hypothetical protein DID77_04630 [Candidatus Marinamargulisbacteria bacterium SCGC AG-439-L15]|nr:hypothetical protein DID77_04630 [Candidatus Marinamargulisbacteria bacterium SCGC AG-439-L15]
MGILLANQKKVTVRHIIEFKENLRVLAISSLFIILSANLKLSEVLLTLDKRSFLFMLVLIFFCKTYSCSCFYIWVSAFF